MNQITLTIPNISCGHCVNAIVSELTENPHITRVTGDPVQKSVTVSFEEPVTETEIRSILTEINYPAQ